MCLNVIYAEAQRTKPGTKPGIGAGIVVQFGLNPKSDVLIWDMETQKVPMNPQKRTLVGTMIQFKNFQKIQFEGGALYGRSVFKNNTDVILGQKNVHVNEWKFPVNINYNAESPVNFHSAIVYHAGLVFTNTSIPIQGMIMKKFTFFTPSISAGVRLASEIRSFGRVEYGISYIKNLLDRHSFLVESDDVAPSMVHLEQKSGQWRLSFVYFFSPRVYSWSKSRYNLNAFD